MVNPSKKYVCPRCNYETPIKRNIKRHFEESKRPCVNRNGLELNRNIYEYIYLNYVFIPDKESISESSAIYDALNSSINLTYDQPISINLISPLQSSQKMSPQEQSTLTNCGCVYMVQPAELKGTSRIKLGASTKSGFDRPVKGYNKGTIQICAFNCKEPFKVETQCKRIFSQIFKLISGTEYFEGDLKLMEGLFLQFALKHKASDLNNSEILDETFQLISEISTT